MDNLPDEGSGFAVLRSFRVGVAMNECIIKRNRQKEKGYNISGPCHLFSLPLFPLLDRIPSLVFFYLCFLGCRTIGSCIAFDVFSLWLLCVLLG